MYVNEEEKKYAAYLTQELRMAGFIVETEYTGRGLKGQFKQADRLNSKYLIILNDEDLQNDIVKIKVTFDGENIIFDEEIDSNLFFTITNEVYDKNGKFIKKLLILAVLIKILMTTAAWKEKNWSGLYDIGVGKMIGVKL